MKHIFEKATIEFSSGWKVIWIPNIKKEKTPSGKTYLYTVEIYKPLRSFAFKSWYSSSAPNKTNAIYFIKDSENE